MFLTFCYYFLSSGLIASACFGTYYYLDKDGATRMAFNISWKGVHLYVKTKTYFDRFSNIFSTKEDNEEFSDADEELPLSLKKFMLYNLKEESIVAVDKITEEVESILQDSSGNHLQFLCFDDNKFLRITDPLMKDTCKDSFTFTKVEKPFIQVELEQNGKITEIHKFLKEHYFEGNKILDKNFLQWYLRYYNLGNLSNNYHLKIIDNDVEMFTIDASQYILLTTDGYECKTNEH